MNKTFRFILLFLNILLVQACVAPPRQPPAPRVTLSPHFNPEPCDRLAVIVLDHTRRIHQSGILRQVEDEFMRTVMEKGYTLITRSDVDRIIEELNFQRSSLTEQQVARIGHVLNVPAVLLVSINQITTQRYQPMVYVQGQRYYVTSVNISARLISAERGEVLWISSFTGDYHFSGERHGELQALTPVASVVASGLPDRLKLH